MPDLPANIVGETMQICVVTRDYRRTMQGLTKMGIGPWRVYTFDAGSCTDLTYRGKPADFAMKLCLAFSGAMMWEIVQPTEGRTIYDDFLEAHGEGIHHVAVDCNGADIETRIARFAERGYKVIQSGKWQGVVPWIYFGTEDDTSTTIETFIIPEDFEMPEPEAWYPAPPEE
ncbi:MAG: VOC family protein [Rhodospirillales bacterium]|nr:VOC family protein [Rhodospirillales bacterium]